MIMNTYFDRIVDVLSKIKNTQSDKISEAAFAVAETIRNDGIIYVFGCGHSHLIALDCFYRAGGLANVCPILDTDLMLHNGAAKSSHMEKMPGLASEIIKRYCLTKKDILVVISTSGKNGVPVEAAKYAKKKGIKTVSIVSSAYFGDKPVVDKLLYECTDIFIDNCVPHGDAVIDIEGIDTKMGSVSTSASSFILQSVILKASEICANDGIPLSVYTSGNVEGGKEKNAKIIDEFMPKIKHL